MTMIRPRNMVSLFSSASVLKSVDHMQYRENSTIITRMTEACHPSQILVLDSRSYFFIMLSTLTSAGAAAFISLFFFLNLPI